MKNLLTTILILLIATASYAQTYTVERVVDAITLKLTNGEEVRLTGIEVSEDEKMGQEATEFVKNIYDYQRDVKSLEGSVVRLEYDVQKKDKYGRILAYVYVKAFGGSPRFSVKGDHTFLTHIEGDVHVFINATIIRAGYATPTTIPPNVKHADLFKKLYEEAREWKRGLWK